MAHGTPDWGLWGPVQASYALDDMGELAARMGSPMLWDRRGDVLSITDWRNGLGEWEAPAVGGGGGITLETEHSRKGAYAINLTAGNTALDPAYLQLNLPYAVAAGIGLEFAFSGEANTSYHQADLYIDDATDLWPFRVRVFRGNGLIQVWGYDPRIHAVANAWRNTATVGALGIMAQPRHACKLTVNHTLQRYIRFILNDHEEDLGMYMVAGAASAATTELRPAIWHYALGATNPVSYIDNVVVTQNEPR